MTAVREASPEQQTFLAELIDAGVFLESGVPGVYGHGAAFDDVRVALTRRFTAEGALENAEKLRFPPVLPRRQMEFAGYLDSFPHLAGTVFSFDGSEADARDLAAKASAHEDWSEHEHMTDVMMNPAACYPVYPVIARRGRLPEGGVIVDTGSAWVFRHEPSHDPARRMTFQMHELVRIAEPQVVRDWREYWIERSLALLRSFGLTVEPDVANDPFFGRQGKMLAAGQRSSQLKIELLVTITGPEPTAVWSCNYHEDHFGHTYGIELSDGGVAHTGCLGIGIERIALAMFAAHGLEPAKWPQAVRDELASEPTL
jgi:seryl-tRNA synthetase